MAVPQKAASVLAYIRTHNWTPPPNHRGGSIYRNLTGLLPAGGTYREYDVDPAIKGVRRSGERIVVDVGTGHAWYTPDHYRTFIAIS